MVQKIISKTWLNLKNFDKLVFKESIKLSKFDNPQTELKEMTLKYFYSVFNTASNFTNMFSQYLFNFVIEQSTQQFFSKINASRSFNEAYKFHLEMLTKITNSFFMVVSSKVLLKIRSIYSMIFDLYKLSTILTSREDINFEGLISNLQKFNKLFKQNVNQVSVFIKECMSL